MIIALAATSIW